MTQADGFAARLQKPLEGCGVMETSGKVASRRRHMFMKIKVRSKSATGFMARRLLMTLGRAV